MVESEPTSVAVVGVGIMGSAIAGRLLDRGHALTLFDLDPEKLAPLVSRGAAVAASPAEACRATRFTILSLNSAAIVRAAVFGPGGVAAGGAAGRILIDMSSIDPAATRVLAAELRAACGMAWVDAPLSGGAPGAAAGRLTVMAGGAPEDVAAARAVMDDLCANYTHMGPNGAGQTTKLVNQVLCAIGFQAVAEAVRLAEAGGVDASRLSAALSGGRADSRILQEFGGKMAARDETPTGRIDNMLKDLEALQGFAAAERLPLPATSLVSDLHRQFVAAGIGAADTVAMMRQFEGYKRDGVY
jgi:2-hydroxy-3-oxopropionate reductase